MVNQLLNGWRTIVTIHSLPLHYCFTIVPLSLKAFFVCFVTSSCSLWFILLKFFNFAQNDENENIFHTKLSKFTQRSQRGCAVLATSCPLIFHFVCFAIYSFKFFWLHSEWNCSHYLTTLHLFPYRKALLGLSLYA